MKFQRRAGLLVLLLLGSGLISFSPSQVAWAQSETDGIIAPREGEQALFTKGQSLYSQGLYSEAIFTFSDFLKRYPDSQIKDLDLLWLGRSYLRTGDIAGAEMIGRRLAEITDTPFAGMYESELRLGQKSSVKSAERASIHRDTFNPSVAVAEVISTNSAAAIKPADTPKSANPSPASPGGPLPGQHSGQPPLGGSLPTASQAVVTTSANAPSIGNLAKVKAPPLSVPQPVPGQTKTAATQRTITANNNHRLEADRTNLAAKSSAPPISAPVPGQKETTGVRVAYGSVSTVAPLLRITTEELPRVGAANGVLFYRVTVTNDGNGAARDLVLREELAETLDFASSDPAPVQQEVAAGSLILSFHLPSVEPGATRSLRLAVRPRPNPKAKTLTMGSATQAKHSLTYRDSKGNPYRTP